MSGDTSLGYVVANKFSMDPDKRQKIFSQCKKEDESLKQRKQEILEKYSNENKKSKTRKNDFKGSESHKRKAKS